MGAIPLSFLGHVDELYRIGVRGVINLCDEYGGPTKVYQQKGIQQLHLPTIDHTEPNLDDLERAFTFMKEVTGRGDAVYIHCKGGHGRR